MRGLAWRDNWKTIIQKLRVVNEVEDEQALIDALSRNEATTVLGFVNAHAMNLVTANPAYYDALSAADVLLRDGSGMAILYRRLGLEPGLNMNGTDFIPKLLAAYKGRRVAFWGTEETFLANAVRHSHARHVRIELRQSQDGDIAVSVEDDGIGLSPASGEDNHFGLAIIRERAASIGARLTIEAIRPHGVRVHLGLCHHQDQPQGSFDGLHDLITDR